MKFIYSVVGREIFIIDKYFKLYLRDSLKHDDLNASEALLLMILFGVNGLTHEQIIEELQYDKGVVTRLTQSLIKKGFVEYKVNKVDRRSKQYYLTEKAYAFKPRLLHILENWSNHIFKDIDTDEITTMLNTLKKISKNTRFIDKDMEI